MVPLWPPHPLSLCGVVAAVCLLLTSHGEVTDPLEVSDDTREVVDILRVAYRALGEVTLVNVAAVVAYRVRNVECEVCRSMKDQNIPYRLSGEKDLHAYSTMSVKNISKLTSPYTALISDEFDNSILHAMLNETPKDTPLEKVLVGENNDQGN